MSISFRSMIGFLLILLPIALFSQSTPANGDIVFTQINATDPDQFQLVTLKRLNLTQLNLTESGICSAGNLFRNTEGVILGSNAFSGMTDVPAGTILSMFIGSGTNVNQAAQGGVVYYHSGTPAFSLSTSGDQVIAYTGTINAGSCINTFTGSIVAGINIGNSGWAAGGASSANNSLNPATSFNLALTPSSTPNGLYSGSVSGNPASIISSVDTLSNWSASSTATTMALPNILFHNSNYASGSASSSVTTSTATLDLSGLTFSGTNADSRYMVVVHSSAPDNPVDRITQYTANTDLNSAPSVITSVTGQSLTNINGTPSTGAGKVVYFGYGLPASLSITGLAPSSTYQYRVYAVNGNGYTAKFSNTPAAGSFTTQGAVFPSVAVSVSAASGQEGYASTITITATTTAAVTGNQSVQFALSGTGISAADFSGSPSLTGSITILDGQSTGSVDYVIDADGVVEGTETVTVTLSAPSTQIVLGSPTTASFQILEPEVTLSSTSLSGFCGRTTSPSAAQSFTISAVDLYPASGNLTVDATGSDWEVSADAVTYTNQLTTPVLNYSSGTLSSNTVYVRLKSGLSVGAKAGSLTISGGGEENKTISLAGSVSASQFSPGDISIIGFNSLGTDAVAFVNWVTIPASASLTITDRNWGTTSFTTGEGSFVWTNGSSALSPGTVTLVSGATADQGSVTGTINGISQTGDNIFLYEGTASCPQFIHGVTFNGAWGTFGNLPGDLNITNGNIVLTSQQNNNEYPSLSRNTLSSLSAYRSAIHNASNWTNSSSNTYSLSSVDLSFPITLTIDSITGSPFVLSTCQATPSGSLYFTASGTFNPGNVFLAQLSDASGSFTSPITIGSGPSSPVSFSIPASMPSGTNYKIRVVAQDPAATSSPSTSFSITLTATGCPSFGDYRSATSGNWNVNTSWEKFGGSGWIACAVGDFPNATTANVTLRTGHTITFTASGPKVNDIVVESGAKLYTNQTGTSISYLDVYGQITCNGIIGNGSVNDAIGFYFSGSNQVVSGSGTFSAYRIRKNNVTNAVTNLTLDMNIELRHFDRSGNGSNTALYNNASNGTFNVLIASGRTLSFLQDADLTIDATNGTALGTEAGGKITVAGTLQGVGMLFARSNNNTQATELEILSGGRVVCDTLIVNNSGNVPFVVDVQLGGLLEVNRLCAIVGGSLPAGSGTIMLNSVSDQQSAILCDSGLTVTLNSPAGAVLCGGSYSGSLTVNRFVPVAGSNQHYVSSPVQNPSFSQLGATGPDGAAIIPTADCDETQSAPNSPYGTIFQYNDGQAGSGNCILGNWQIRSAGNLVNGRGYSAYLTGNAAISFVGEPNTGDVSVSTTNSGFPTVNTLQGAPLSSGWNLLGNPYPCPIRLTTLRPGFDAQVGVWQTSGPYSGSFQMFLVGSGTEPIIAPGQGFLVRQSAAGSLSYTLLRAERTATDIAPFYAVNIQDRLNLKLLSSGSEDVLEIGFNALASDTFDSTFDADKLWQASGRPSIFSPTGPDRWYAIRTQASLTHPVSLPVSFRPAQGGMMTIQPQGVNTFDPTVLIFLEDLLTGEKHNLRSGDYTFQANSGDDYNRFMLHIFPAIQVETYPSSCEQANGRIVLDYAAPGNWNYSLAGSSVVQNGSLQSHADLIGLPEGVYTLQLEQNGYVVEKTVFITGSALPSAGFLPSQNIVTTGTSVAFDAIAGSSVYAWDFGDGTSNNSGSHQVSHVYTQPGLYEVSLLVQNADSCEAFSSSWIQVLSSVTAVEENTSSVSFASISGNQLIMGLGAAIGKPLHIQLADLSGRLVYTAQVVPTSALFSTELPVIPSGVYLLEIRGDGWREIKKIIQK